MHAHNISAACMHSPPHNLAYFAAWQTLPLPPELDSRIHAAGKCHTSAFIVGAETLRPPRLPFPPRPAGHANCLSCRSPVR